MSGYQDRWKMIKWRRRLSIILGTLMVSASAMMAYADLDILVVGSTRSFSDSSLTTWNETNVVHEAAFNPSNIVVELQSILDQDAAITGAVNVVFDDIYKMDTRYVQTSKTGFNTWDLHCYSLAQHYMWPAGKTNRLADLRGQLTNSPAWDYVVIMADPYILANFPGMYTEGAKMLIDEIRAGTAEPILMAQWPETNSTFSVSDFNEVVYRTGDSASVRVVPAGKAWESLSPKTPDASHPTPDGAYLAAASIYSELFARSATNSAYAHDDAIADHARNVVQTNQGLAQYTGAYTNITPFTMKYVPKRLVSFRETGTSTEDRIRGELDAVDSYFGITVTTTATHDPTDWDFNYGRGNDRWEDDKDYSVNPSIYDRSYGFAMHYYGTTNAIRHMPYGIDKQNFDDDPWNTYEDGTDLGIAYNMIRPYTRETSLPADVRCAPIRLMWTKMADLAAPGLNPLGDNTHMATHLNQATASYMLTLLNGRCPITDEPTPQGSSAWNNWLGRKIGYETAWRMSHVTTRVPGFQVMPASTDDTVTPSASTTLAVKFWYAPTSDVTVVVSTDDHLAGNVSPAVLTFTPSNYTNAQTVTVLAQTGAAGSYDFNVSFSTTSSDPIYDSLADSWEFTNTRPEGPLPSDIRVMWNGVTLVSGDMSPDVVSGTDFGATIGSVVHTFVITNTSGSTTHNLTNSPRVTLTGASDFSRTQDALTGSLPPGASTTFDITYSPSAAGTHTALVVVASTDATVPAHTFALSGVRPSAATVALAGSSAIDPANAMLSGVLTTGVVAQAWICWGLTDAGTDNTGDWDNVVGAGLVTDGVIFSAGVSGLAANSTYFYRCYAENDSGSDWSDSSESFSGSPTGSGGGTSAVVSISAVYAHNEKNNYDGRINDMIIGSGMNGHGIDGTNTWPTGEGLPATWTPSSSAYQNEYVSGDLLDNESPLNGKIGWAIFDLGSVVPRLENLYLWNTRNSASSHAASFNVYYAETPSVAPVHGPTDSTSIDYDFSSGGWVLANTGGELTGSHQGNQSVALGGNAGRYVAVEFLSNGGHADRVGLAEVGITALEGSMMKNSAPTGITVNSATFHAELVAHETDFDVYVYYGSSNGGTNAGAWGATDYLGSWTNVATDLSYGVTGLSSDQTYYYTFMASNAIEMVWAVPSWQFTTLGSEPATTNHSVPHAWLTSQDPGWTNNYEAVVMADQDGDGFLTWEEYWSGTDPMNSNSHLRVDTILYNGTNVVLEWQHAEVDAGIPDIMIEASTNLASGPWVIVGTNTPINGTNIWMDVSLPRVFFRLVATNAP